MIHQSMNLSAQRKAYDEIRRSIPRPFARILVPKEVLQKEFDKAVAECSNNSSFEMRPIRTTKTRGNAGAAPGRAAPAGAAPVANASRAAPERA